MNNGIFKSSIGRRVVLLAGLLLPAAACGPGGSVYVGVSAPGPWTSYPGGYYPGAWGYPGYRWEEEQEEEEQDGAELVEWEAPWAGTSTPTPATPQEEPPQEDVWS